MVFLACGASRRSLRFLLQLYCFSLQRLSRRWPTIVALVGEKLAARRDFFVFGFREIVFFAHVSCCDIRKTFVYFCCLPCCAAAWLAQIIHASLLFLACSRLSLRPRVFSFSHNINISLLILWVLPIALRRPTLPNIGDFLLFGLLRPAVGSPKH